MTIASRAPALSERPVLSSSSHTTRRRGGRCGRKPVPVRRAHHDTCSVYRPKVSPCFVPVRESEQSAHNGRDHGAGRSSFRAIRSSGDAMERDAFGASLCADGARACARQLASAARRLGRCGKGSILGAGTSRRIDAARGGRPGSTGTGARTSDDHVFRGVSTSSMRGSSAFGLAQIRALERRAYEVRKASGRVFVAAVPLVARCGWGSDPRVMT